MHMQIEWIKYIFSVILSTYFNACDAQQLVANDYKSIILLFSIVRVLITRISREFF